MNYIFIRLPCSSVLSWLIAASVHETLRLVTNFVGTVWSATCGGTNYMNPLFVRNNLIGCKVLNSNCRILPVGRVCLCVCVVPYGRFTRVLVYLIINSSKIIYSSDWFMRRRSGTGVITPSFMLLIYVVVCIYYRHYHLFVYFPYVSVLSL